MRRRGCQGDVAGAAVCQASAQVVLLTHMRLQACPRALRVMTWNLWDMSLITPHHNARVAGMCRALEDNVDNIDIVGLQECWCETTRVRLIAAAERGGLKHHHAFVSGVDLPLGVRGPGLMVLSRFPIVDVAFVRWVRGACWWYWRCLPQAQRHVNPRQVLCEWPSVAL